MTNPIVEEVMKSPVALLESLCNDCQRLNPAVEGLKRDLQTLKQRFENEGYGFLTVALPALDEAILIGLSTRKFTCPTGFKVIRGGAIPRFLSGMLCEVFDPITGMLKDDIDICVLKTVRNILRFFKKMRLSPEDEEILHKKAVNEFFQCDIVAGQVILPDREYDLIGRVSKLILNNLNSKDVSNATYKHGPGAVEEGYRANQKWYALSNALRSEAVDTTTYGLDIWARFHDRYSSSHLCDEAYRSTHVGGRIERSGLQVGFGNGSRNHRIKPNGVSLFGGASGRNARLISVLKNSTSRRTITVEPMLNQFIQQGLNTLLREAISECKVLSNCLALTDQSKNQVLALEGSLLDNWATIDLKSASDLLSVKLVESVFRHHGLFFDHMMDCRSVGVYCDLTETKHLNKFAGMGNALTFPVQSICFAVISIAAILDSWGKTPTYSKVRQASRLIRVYGDDIIIDSRYAQQCVNWLHNVGLKVNVKKSFLEGNFKESCGVEAYKGVDITPLYIKHRPDDGVADPSIIAGFVSLSNSLWMEGLYETSTCLRTEVEERLGYSLPLVARESGLLGWHSRVDTSFAHKWCKRTQQLLVRAPRLASVKREDRISGYAALLKCLSKANSLKKDDSGFATWIDRVFPLAGDDPDHLNSTPIRYKSRIKQRWVPVRCTGYLQ
jgi:hypothetical protein